MEEETKVTLDAEKKLQGSSSTRYAYILEQDCTQGKQMLVRYNAPMKYGACIRKTKFIIYFDLAGRCYEFYKQGYCSFEFDQEKRKDRLYFFLCMAGNCLRTYSRNHEAEP